MITREQPRTIEAVYRNGVTAYVYESLGGSWGIRFCDRPWRGTMVKELPNSLRGTYPSADAANKAIERHYRTTVVSAAVTPRM
jgi:hypothetical protein